MMHICSHCSPKYKVYISNGSDEESDEKKKNIWNVKGW